MLQAQGIVFEKGFTDLSFRKAEGWPTVSQDAGSPPSLWISFGDPEAGPAAQLGICPTVPDKMWLDTHYHATDQLRAVIQGRFQLQRKTMRPGDFGYQIAGIPYREVLVAGGDDPLWMFAIQDDRRGARSTTTRSDGSFQLGEVADDQLDRPVNSVDDPYWDAVPGGAQGVSALAASQGRTTGGFCFANFDQASDWALAAPGVRICAGLLGDAIAGPMALAISAEPGATILPPHAAATEIMIVPMEGAVDMGQSRLEPGDLRIANAAHHSEALIAGPNGAGLLYIFGDRRAADDIKNSDVADHPAIAAIRMLQKRLSKSIDPTA